MLFFRLFLVISFYIIFLVSFSFAKVFDISEYSQNYIYNKINKVVDQKIAKSDIKVVFVGDERLDSYLNDSKYKVILNKKKDADLDSDIKQRWIIPFEVYENNVLIQKEEILVKADIFANVAFSSRDIKRGESLSTSNVFFVSSNIAVLPKNIFWNRDNLIDSEAVFNIKEGQLLTDRLVRRKPDVVRGNEVKIKSVFATISVETEGIAQRDAYIGEEVKVQNSSTNKYVVGKVVAKNLVLVGY